MSKLTMAKILGKLPLIFVLSVLVNIAAGLVIGTWATITRCVIIPVPFEEAETLDWGVAGGTS